MPTTPEGIKKKLMEMSTELSMPLHGKPRTRTILYDEAVKTLRRVQGTAPIIEIGTWRGGSALALMAAIFTVWVEKHAWHSLITVDPFYDFNVETSDPKAINSFNICYIEMLGMLAFATRISGVYQVHYKVTDHTYRDRIWYTPHYLGHEPVSEPRFSFVHLDDGHEMGSEKEQLAWFIPRLTTNGNILIDDACPGREDKLREWLPANYGGRILSMMEWIYR